MILKSWTVFTGLKIFTAQKDREKKSEGQVIPRRKERGREKTDQQTKTGIELGSAAPARRPGGGQDSHLHPPASWGEIWGHEDMLDKPHSPHIPLPRAAASAGFGVQAAPQHRPYISHCPPSLSCSSTACTGGGQHQGTPKTHPHVHTHTRMPMPSWRATMP